MRLHVVSDLHIEFGPLALPTVDADVIVLAGDIHVGTQGLDWARKAANDRRVLYVPGNHEYYHSDMQEIAAEMRRSAQELGIVFLDNDAIVLDGVRILGTTLWTDFELYGAGAELGKALSEARRRITDFHVIRHGSSGEFSPEQSVTLHRTAVKWLDSQLTEPFAGPTVVITHHCPHPGSIPTRFRGDPLTPAFCSDLSALIRKHEPVLWIHGHTHDSFDYHVGRTRVVCNPRGYVPFEPNPRFDSSLIIRLTSPEVH